MLKLTASWEVTAREVCAWEEAPYIYTSTRLVGNAIVVVLIAPGYDRRVPVTSTWQREGQEMPEGVCETGASTTILLSEIMGTYAIIEIPVMYGIERLRVARDCLD